MEVVDDEAAAGTRDGQAGGGDGIDVLLPDVDGPHLVPSLAEEAGVHRAHRSSSDNRDLHAVLCVQGSESVPAHQGSSDPMPARRHCCSGEALRRFYGIDGVRTKPWWNPGTGP